MHKSFFHLVLAIQLLVSTTGIGLFVHVCQNDGAIASFLTKAKCSCTLSDEKQQPASCCLIGEDEDKDNCEHDSQDCCSDHFELIKSDTELPRTQYSTPSEPDTDLANTSLVFGVSDSAPLVLNSVLNYNFDYPPPPEEDLWLLHQAFLC